LAEKQVFPFSKEDTFQEKTVDFNEKVVHILATPTDAAVVLDRIWDQAPQRKITGEGIMED
jgi:hypothetical protein